jgi:hypothetical protein
MQSLSTEQVWSKLAACQVQPLPTNDASATVV